MSKSKKLHHYTACGLDWVYLENGFKVEETAYGRGMSVENADELHEAIAREVILSPALMRGQELRFLRSLLDCSQSGLAHSIGVTRATVARWEAEPNAPISPTADRVVRLLYAGSELKDKTVQRILELMSDIDALDRQHRAFAETDGKWAPAPKMAA